MPTLQRTEHVLTWLHGVKDADGVWALVEFEDADGVRLRLDGLLWAEMGSPETVHVSVEAAA